MGERKRAVTDSASTSKKVTSHVDVPPEQKAEVFRCVDGSLVLVVPGSDTVVPEGATSLGHPVAP